MVDFNPAQLQALSSMINPVDENDDGHIYGSALNPATIRNAKGDKELAKPNVQVEVKTFNRDAKGGAPAEELKAAEEAKALAARLNDPKNVIWTPEEVQEAAEEQPDDRLQPDFDFIPKQHVGTEDLFLGLSDRDASSNHCDALLVKVWLPNTQFKNVELDVKGQQTLVVQSPNFFLNKILPYKVDKTKAKAKFDSDKCVLEVTFPVIKLEIIDRLLQDAARYENEQNAEYQQFAV